jgi:predicted ATPase/DNA-binding SARP family transcriptional activator
MTPPPLTIHLFGPLRVTVRGEPLPRVRTRSVEWLLALLTLRHGRPVNRAWLAGTLWPASSGSRSLQNLRNELVRLRQALGPESARIQSPAADSLLLDLTGAGVDVLQFDTAIQAGDEDALRRAVEVYTGPLLEECPAEWAFTERATRAEQFLAALETLAGRVAARRDHGASIQYLRRAEALDPLRDSVVQQLMSSLAAAGDPAAAIQTYRDFRIRLQEELAAAPEEATTRLFHEIRTATRHQAAQRRLPPAASVGAGETRSPYPLPERLPRPLTSLIGRDLEVEQIREALRQVCLLTMVGGGGVGKTRLALEVALQTASEAPYRTAWVELASLADGALVLPSVAAALGVRDAGAGGAGGAQWGPGPGRLDARVPAARVGVSAGGHSELASAGGPGGALDAEALTRRLVARLSESVSLLVLDNCEHLLDAVAAVVRRLLQCCPELHILTTSRQRLGLPGEVAWRVPSLSVPGIQEFDHSGAQERALERPEHLMQYASVRLFVERASTVHPEFRLASGAEAAAVAQICRRLDGIPLAIELAAARVRVLTPQQIAERLDDRFNLLTRGARGALPRHQTLRALIDWSYDSLPEEEAALLRRLSVFAGGWTLEAAEAICAGVQAFRRSGVQAPSESKGDSVLSSPERLNVRTPERPDEVLDLLDSLVDRSLVLVDEAGEARFDARVPAERVDVSAGGRAPGQGLRYRMLETLREYSREKLACSDEWAAVRNRHRDWYLQLAEQVEAEAPHSERAARLTRPEAELDNLRAALAWCHEAAEADLTPRASGTAAESGLRLADALYWLWLRYGYPLEDSLSLERALVRDTAAPVPLRARALLHAAQLARDWGRSESAASYLQSARLAYEEVLNLAQIAGDRKGAAEAILVLARVAFEMGDMDAAWSHGLEARQRLAELGNQTGVVRSLGVLSDVSQSRGDRQGVRSLQEERLALSRELGSPGVLIHALGSMGHLMRDEGDYARARSLYQESLVLRHELSDRIAVAQSLEDLAVLAGRERQADRAIRLLGAGEAFCETLGVRPPAAIVAEYERTVTEGRAALSGAAFAAAWAEGRAMSIEQAIEYALGDP